MNYRRIPIDILRMLKHSRGKKFFSETGEDSILANLVSSKRGRYLDVGASHPIIGSNTYLLYRLGWHGIAVEPQKQFNMMWRLSRHRDRLHNCVIGDEGETIFFRFQNSLLSTTNTEVANVHISRGMICNEEKLLSISLSKLLPSELNPTEEFLLNLDVEGAEFECLSTVNFTVQRPRYIVIESWSLPWIKKSKAINFLERNGYIVIAYSGLSAVLVPQEILESLRGLRQTLSEFD